jgi:hypothetical protein
MLLFRRIALVASARSLIAGGLYSRHKKYSSDRLVDCRCKNDVCVVEEYLFGYVGDYMYEVTVEALKCKKCGKIHEIDDQDDVEIEYKINF